MVKSKGIGDDINKFTEKTGIKKIVKKIFGDDCGCEERRQKLNAMFPHIKNTTPFTEDQKRIYEQVVPEIEKANQITKDQKYVLQRLYTSAFGSPPQFNNCGKCNQKILDNLKRVYEKSCDNG